MEWIGEGPRRLIGVKGDPFYEPDKYGIKWKVLCLHVERLPCGRCNRAALELNNLAIGTIPCCSGFNKISLESVLAIVMARCVVD